MIVGGLHTNILSLSSRREEGRARSWNARCAGVLEDIEYSTRRVLMPIYEYECRQCGHQFEYLVLSSSPRAECPSCQAQDVEQLISMCAVSSENTKQANLSAAHRKAGAVRKDKQHEEHKSLHEHFHDQPTTARSGKTE